MSKGMLFELFMNAEEQRALEYVKARCRKDQSLAGLFNAEYIQREADRVREKMPQ